MQDELKKLDNHRTARFLIAGFIFLVGLGAVVSDSVQKSGDKREAEQKEGVLTQQVLILISSAQVQATKDDVKLLGETVATGSNNIVAAINNLKRSSETPMTTRPSETKPSNEGKQVAAQPPVVPTIENTRLVQRAAPSSDPKLPYGLQVIIQSNITVDPVAFAFQCDGEVGRVDFFIAGQGAYMNVQVGPAAQNKNIAIVRFGFPPLRPETPLVLTILSEKEIHVVRAFKLNP